MYNISCINVPTLSKEHLASRVAGSLIDALRDMFLQLGELAESRGSTSRDMLKQFRPLVGKVWNRNARWLYMRLMTAYCNAMFFSLASFCLKA